MGIYGDSEETYISFTATAVDDVGDVGDVGTAEVVVAGARGRS